MVPACGVEDRGSHVRWEVEVDPLVDAVGGISSPERQSSLLGQRLDSITVSLPGARVRDVCQASPDEGIAILARSRRGRGDHSLPL